ncbi:MAG TPA: hypothetical protein VNU97_05665 [Rhizomicrobium sp.]|jgi:hypothetical protein|nr:hypothetical protein [Rhizomicrobium sp.]
MNKSRFLTLTILLALSGFGSAYAQAPALAAGTYKLAIGTKAPCDLTITADGAVTQAADCATGTNLTKWAPTTAGYQLLSADGATYAVLKPHGETLEGVTFADQHKLVLSH